jgi:hypothetical protein
MSRNKNSSKKGSRVSSKNAPRPIRGSRYLEEIGGIEKFKNTRRQARRVWAREDNRY